ncbi:MAG: preprotein translocase subunit SecA [Candidatus Portnoybacteria bacterium]|nr:preprotein translocase subunit SecA [Candidatus Portnoybacteria bacterium]
MSFLSKIFSFGEKRILKNLEEAVGKINALEEKVRKIKLEEFPQKTQKLKKRLEKGETLDDILPEAFSYVREAAYRTLEQRHFDVQLMGGIILHQGKIAEMRTGEGKTLAATAPAYLNALTGKGVHIITVNEYLAERDAVWMGQIYSALGLSVAALTDTQSFLYQPVEKGVRVQGLGSRALDEERDVVGAFKVEHEFLQAVDRKAAYQADIVYGTNHAFGFDYLRDNLVPSVDAEAQRPYYYAIIDEVDSILIDEARTPLIISQPQEDASKFYIQFAHIARQLKENLDYNIDEKRRAVSLTTPGLKHIERLLGKNIYETGEIDLIFHLEQGLKANTLFLRDRDYVVKEGKVIIVDEFTGRLMPDRRYSEGIHQAIEAKEGVPIQQESKTVATVTIQNFFKKYPKLAGMTGTAITSAEEFDKVYGLEVAVIPTHKEMIRQDLPDRIYKNTNAKWRAVTKEIRERHQKGQPILVGTVSVEKNEFLSRLLRKSGIKHEVLNAKNHEREGEIIAQAGREGSVTVATNMAGRGVDIILGGNPPSLKEAQRVKAVGGLFVLGTERHEARRIDNQLRGRTGRQGDPGQTQFFTSLDDDLMRIFGGDTIKGLMERFNFPEDMPIEHKLISSSIERAQSQVEGYNLDIRKRLLEYDEVINKQRDSVYKRRLEILVAAQNEPEKLKENVLDMLADEVEAIVEFHTQGTKEEWNIKEIGESFKSITNYELGIKNKEDKEKIKEELITKCYELYEEREQTVTSDLMRQVEKTLLLRSIDTSWSDYLDSLDHLRSAVGLRGVGGHDPLVEFKTEAKRMFHDLLADINRKVIDTIFKIQVHPAMIRPQPVIVSHQELQGEKVGLPAEVRQGRTKVGRNDPCPCGAKDTTGKPIKFKKCHGG